MKRLALLFLAAAAVHGQSAEVTGSVVDARGGEALSHVGVQLVGTAWRATTGSTGRFRIPGIPPGDYILNVSTVGYHLVKKSFHLDRGETTSAPSPTLLSSSVLRTRKAALPTTSHPRTASRSTSSKVTRR